MAGAELGGAGGPVMSGVIHDASCGFTLSLGFLSLIAAALVLAAVRFHQISLDEERPAIASR